MVNKFFNFFNSAFSPNPYLRSYIVNGFYIRFLNFTFSATLKVKSGLSTVSNISGSKFSIAFTVSFIFFLILKIFIKTLVKPKYVISLRS